MLICPVRNCGLALERQGNGFVCSARHSFDLARSGYVNLLQPQDKKSKEPGDSKAAVAARRRLQDLGVSQPMLAEIREMLALTPDDRVLDAGCGEGFYLGHLTNEANCVGAGTDLSIPAIDAAARKYPHCQWVVANADRQLPFASGAFSVVMSITARMNAPEFARVLAPGGRLLVALAGPDDLIEIRGAGRDRVERTVDEFAAHFKLQSIRRITHHKQLAAASVEDLRTAIYRPLQANPAHEQSITFSFDLLLFAILKA